MGRTVIAVAARIITATQRVIDGIRASSSGDRAWIDLRASDTDAANNKAANNKEEGRA